MPATIASLHVYPVKSCRGIALDTSPVGERGLAFDREWMIVDRAGRFVTQRDLPHLALIEPSLTGAALELEAPGAPRLTVPLDLGGTALPVTVWNDSFAAIDQGDGAAAWLSSVLHLPLRLVRFDRAVRRLCNVTYVGDSGAHTGFADAYPLLILSEASLADLNSRLEEPLPMNRFRPNVVLSGIDAYDEDHFDEIRLGSLAFKLVKHCTRCQITTTDQSTAAVGAEPLATLARYRMNDALGGVTFGMNAIVASGAGLVISCGDRASCAFKF
jgi:MOSC domain-containing protein